MLADAPLQEARADILVLYWIFSINTLSLVDTCTTHTSSKKSIKCKERLEGNQGVDF